MLTLYLVRHATAVPAGSGVGDHDRPLTPGGVGEAEALGRFLAGAGLACDAAACSSALRTRQTAEALLRGAGAQRSPESADELYNASGDTLLRWIHARPAGSRRLLVVAHMPGVGELTSLLATEHSDLALGFPAATLAVIESEVEAWADWDYGRGALQLLLPGTCLGGLEREAQGLRKGR